MRQQGENGVALLSVMFILTLLTVVAVYMVEADHLLVRKASNQRTVEQGFQLAVGSEQWATRILQRDVKESETDYLQEDWNTLGTPVTVDDGEMRTSVIDLQSRFNLNNLGKRDEHWYPAFKRLLVLLEIDQNLAEAVVDWIDADQQRTHGAGAEDLEYQLYDPPYRAANRKFSDLGELALIQGVNLEIMQRLAPYVTVIPDQSNSLINVNTCPPLLLQILGKGITAQNADSLADGRGEEGYKSIEAFLQRPELAGEAHQSAQFLVSLSSEYFLVRSDVRLERLNLSMHSVVKRNNASAAVSVISRQRGYL